MIVKASNSPASIYWNIRQIFLEDVILQEVVTRSSTISVMYNQIHCINSNEAHQTQLYFQY